MFVQLLSVRLKKFPWSLLVYHPWSEIFFHFSEKGIPVTWLKYSQIFGLRRSLSYTIRSLQVRKTQKQRLHRTTSGRESLLNLQSCLFPSFFYPFFRTFFSLGPLFLFSRASLPGILLIFFWRFFLSLCVWERDVRSVVVLVQSFPRSRSRSFKFLSWLWWWSWFRFHIYCTFSVLFSCWVPKKFG